MAKEDRNTGAITAKTVVCDRALCSVGVSARCLWPCTHILVDIDSCLPHLFDAYFAQRKYERARST
jgi:hypothetical protein